ncbi:hypothetical protein [Mucilaginibacter flavus]|uniref:hypothetical protein n=1 Tax=Mucilaginibacter flavus TaxID=931504 RepID=UPI0025B2C68A|nr:hypothetical protein [Mucilaginibacter flavus]MDN3580089.1 hypothetical protein [Mucilaginibacter flavus]
MLKHFFLLILASTFSALVYGQSNRTGLVYESGSRVVLPNIQVENLTTHNVVLTDRAGAFKIAGKNGEILVFSGSFYKADTVLLTNNKPMEIALIPQHNMLSEVKVTATEATHTGSFQSPDFHNQTVVYQRDEKGNYKGGVAIRLSYFKKDEHKREKQAAFLKDQEQQDQIAQVFNAKKISEYLPLKGKDMDDFLILYTPSPKTYFTPAFNLAAYLDTSYKEFIKIPADQRKTQLEQAKAVAKELE